MIISKTPYRISFFGGGTDFPEWFKEHGGAVISTTIDKYCYISIRHLPPFFEHKDRIVYSDIELVKDRSLIKHPAVKEVLEFFYKGGNGVEIHHDGDLPARSGLGSSSSFTVGLLNALYAMFGRRLTKKELADKAIFIEREAIKEAGGLQDQIAASYGGFNKITFNGDYNVSPMVVPYAVKEELQKGLCLFFTGKSRTAELIERSKLDKIKDRIIYFHKLNDLTKEAEKLFSSLSFTIEKLGYLLQETWELKKSLADGVTNSDLDTLYQRAIKAGAYGGKLLGAGGGGFILFAVAPHLKNRLIEEMYPCTYVPFKFEYAGSQIVLYDPESFS